MDEHSEHDLEQLLSFIQGWGAGTLTTYPDDPKTSLTHQGCLELEKRGLITRFKDEPTFVIWKPVEQKRPGPSETKGVK